MERAAWHKVSQLKKTTSASDERNNQAEAMALQAMPIACRLYIAAGFIIWLIVVIISEILTELKRERASASEIYMNASHLTECAFHSFEPRFFFRTQRHTTLCRHLSHSVQQTTSQNKTKNIKCSLVVVGFLYIHITYLHVVHVHHNSRQLL